MSERSKQQGHRRRVHTGPPYKIAPGADGWCSHAGAVHQDVPGCGRVCSDATHRGVKNKNIWGRIADVSCSECPDAEWPGCTAGNSRCSVAKSFDDLLDEMGPAAPPHDDVSWDAG